MFNKKHFAKKLGRFRFIYFPYNSNFAFYHNKKVKRGTWFLDVWRFRVWRDGSTK
jgi:hypothetical protein